jgi:hypothetical protein
VVKERWLPITVRRKFRGVALVAKVAYTKVGLTSDTLSLRYFIRLVENALAVNRTRSWHSSLALLSQWSPNDHSQLIP